MPNNAINTDHQIRKSFTTAAIPPHERVEFWEAHNADALIGLDIRPLHTQTLEAHQQNKETSITRTAKVLGSSQLVERSSSMIRKHPTDAVALFFCTQGDSFYSDEHGTHLLHPGQLLVCNADSPFIRGFGAGVSELVLTISMDEFRKLSGEDTLTHPKKFTFGSLADEEDSNTPAARIAELVNRTLRESDNDSFESDVLSWVEQLVHDTNSDVSQLFSQAQYFLKNNLERPGLRRADIARLLHVSERQVTRIFAAHDTNFSRELLLHRIEKAQSILRAEQFTPIAEVARRCGFRSTAYFSRVFKKVTGHSPTQAEAVDRMIIPGAAEVN